MMPSCTSFGSENSRNGVVQMALDEYETIRLIDFEGLTQEQCAKQLGVARTTVQSIYSKARKKLAKCLVEGLSLVIEGGEYHVCEHHGGECGLGCRHRRSRRCYRENENAGESEEQSPQ